MTKCCIRYLAVITTGCLSFFAWLYLQKREPKVYKNGIVKPALGLKPKVYIYPLHPKFNSDIITDCDLDVHVNNYGFGDLLYKDGELGIYETNQFSLEVVLHEQLLHRKYRTNDPSKADIFYIPSYLGLASFCFQRNNSVVSLQDELFKTIRSFPYFDQGRPHVSALAKIEREQYNLLRNPLCRNVTYVVIEKGENSPYFLFL